MTDKVLWEQKHDGYSIIKLENRPDRLGPEHSIHGAGAPRQAEDTPTETHEHRNFIVKKGEQQNNNMWTIESIGFPLSKDMLGWWGLSEAYEAIDRWHELQERNRSNNQ